MLVAKEVPLCCDHDRKIIKYGLFLLFKDSWENYKPIKKELMTFNKTWEHKHFFPKHYSKEK